MFTPSVESQSLAVTHTIKFVLRSRIKLIRSDHTQKANAMSAKIEKAIVASNEARLASIYLAARGGGEAATAAMWSRVRDASGKGKNQPGEPPAGISPNTLNTYYATVSHDTDYSPPVAQASCFPRMSQHPGQHL